MNGTSKLATAIVADGRTARQIAADAGVSEITLSLIRTGRRRARLETALKISRVLGQCPSDLGLPDLDSIEFRKAGTL